jgi:HTH-type transcriptional regulator/antitoxin HigA
MPRNGRIQMATKRPTAATVRPAAVDYLALVRRHPLRPIRTKAEYDAALSVLDKLAVREEGTLTPGEQDYLDALTAFVERYDDEHHAEPLPRPEPAALLREMMDQAGVTVTELGKLFGGSKGVASELVAGKRPWTLKSITKLADRFGVSPAVFLPRPKLHSASAAKRKAAV